MPRFALFVVFLLLPFLSVLSHERVSTYSASLVTAQKPPRRILFIGDSITDGGWGNSGGSSKSSQERSHGDMNHIFGHGYMEMCAAHFLSLYPQRDYLFFNRGISGNTIYDMQKRWKTDALDINPDVISILIGTNDIHEFLNEKSDVPYDFSRWEQTYRSLLDEIKKQNPDIRIVLATPFVAKAGWVGESDNFEQRKTMVEQLAEIVRKIAADYHAVLLPFDELFKSIQPQAPRDNYWIWDGIHPTTAGHRRMADLWISNTADLFAE